MVKKIFAQTYLWVLLLLLYSPIVIIVIYSFTEAKVLGNWTGFSTKLYSSLFNTGAHHSLMNALVNTITIALLAATASTLLGSIAAIGIFNLKARSRKAIGFVNSIPILNGDIITGISLFLLFVSLGITQVQSPNQKIPDRKTKCVIKTHINIKQNVIFGAKLKPV